MRLTGPEMLAEAAICYKDRRKGQVSLATACGLIEGSGRHSVDPYV